MHMKIIIDYTFIYLRLENLTNLANVKCRYGYGVYLSGWASMSYEDEWHQILMAKNTKVYLSLMLCVHYNVNSSFL